MEKEKVVIDGFIRLSTVIASLQKNLERVKTDRARPFHLRNTEVLVMYLFHKNPEGLSAEQMANECKLDRSLISRVLRSLSEKQLVFCPDKPEGKRRYGARLFLTEKGKELCEIIQQHARRIQAYLDEGIPMTDLETMYATLDTLCRRFEELNSAAQE